MVANGFESVNLQLVVVVVVAVYNVCRVCDMGLDINSTYSHNYADSHCPCGR